jgi:hypothetical protein
MLSYSLVFARWLQHCLVCARIVARIIQKARVRGKAAATILALASSTMRGTASGHVVGRSTPREGVCLASACIKTTTKTAALGAAAGC